ncbi:MAG TPA: T9SS type A sorting domain-containing protein, partial [Bacteroidales bacterium]|nr:T9SS type A sorting domain-containing protein [Bacteroidales bacterium]
IVGKLTGGGALCSNLFSPDYFGRFASSWEYSPTLPEHQLRHWLDPENTGTEIVYGIFYDNILYASFRADTTVIPTKGAVNFTDQSVGGVSSWLWEFPGATPSSSTEQNPSGIFYNTTGDFDVTLIISNGDSSDTLVKTNYIRVLPAVAGKLYTDHLLLLIGSHEHNELKWELLDMSGKLVVAETLNINGFFSAILRFGHLSSGMYVLRVTFDKGSTLTQKIIISK